MHQLTREVRFSLQPGQPPSSSPILNGHAGNPLDGLFHYFALQITVAGQPDPHSAYLLNIRDIDQRVRQHAVPAIARLLTTPAYTPARALLAAHDAMHNLWPQVSIAHLCLEVTPFFSLSLYPSELPMLRMSQRFEFSASHRLHNPALGDAENQELFGKCNNPEGHGHNYELEVQITGPLDPAGRILPLSTLERLVHDHILERFDHKHLNRQTAEFRHTIPSVENIAKTIFDLLHPVIPPPAKLAAVTVWETPKTNATYSE